MRISECSKRSLRLDIRHAGYTPRGTCLRIDWIIRATGMSKRAMLRSYSWNQAIAQLHSKTAPFFDRSSSMNPTPSSTPETISDPLPLAEASLLNAYQEQMYAESVPWQEREMRLNSAEEYLQWCRPRERTKEDSIVFGPVEWITDETAEWNLRETYLRHAYPERDFRAIKRAHLNHFLRYLSLIHAGGPYYLIEQNPKQSAAPALAYS